MTTTEARETTMTIARQQVPLDILCLACRDREHTFCARTFNDATGRNRRCQCPRCVPAKPPIPTLPHTCDDDECRQSQADGRRCPWCWGGFPSVLPKGWSLGGPVGAR